MGPDRIDLFPTLDDPERLRADELFDALSFAPPDRAGDAATASDEPVQIRDARTGLRLTLPAGWSSIPDALLQSVAGGQNVLRSDSARVVFAAVRDDTFTASASELLAFVAQPLADVPSSFDGLCDEASRHVRILDAHAEAGPPRSIGGREFCSFHFSVGGRAHRIFAAAIDLEFVWFTGSLADPREPGQLDALLDAVEFE